MPVMGLDLSCTGTGICVLDMDGTVRHMETVGYRLGVKERGHKSTVREEVERQVAIVERVVAVRDQWDVRDVAVENYSYSARGAQNDLAELGGAVKMQLWIRNGIEVRRVQVNAARAAALGKGNVPKRDVPGIVRERGVALAEIPHVRAATEYDGNQADAWVVAEWLRKQLNGC